MFSANWYSGNSTYAFYPFTVPSEMKVIQRSVGLETEYDYDKPQIRPTAKIITDFTTVVSILRDSTSYTLPWSEAVRQLGHDSHTLHSNGTRAIKQQKLVRKAVSSPQSSIEAFTRFIELTTREHILKNRSHKLRDVFEICMIKHVNTLSWTEFAARLLYIPLKNSPGSKASFDCEQLYLKMSSIFRFLYLDTDPTKSHSIKKIAMQANKDLVKDVKEVCEALRCSSFAHVLLHRDSKTMKDDFMPNHGTELLQRLFDVGKTVDEVTSLVVMFAVDLVVTGSFAVCNHLDLVLPSKLC